MLHAASCTRVASFSVKVLVNQDVPPAKYCGTLLAEGYPDLAIPVAVTVEPPAA